MIIYSNTGQRPVDLALEKIKEQKNICCVQIKDDKYHITKSIAKEKLDAVFDNKTPYCLCDDVEKTTGEVKPFYCPAIVCSSEKGNWVMLKNYEMIPVGLYKQMEKLDIHYLDFEYEKKPSKVIPLPLPDKFDDTKNMRFRDETARRFWEQLKDLFTAKYDPGYSNWDSIRRCWVQTYDNKVRSPIGYPSLYILKTGGWSADWSALAPNVEKYKSGDTSNKLIGKIEKYIMADIYATKEYARQSAYDMDYMEKEYYLTEMQAGFLTLRACLYLKRCHIKIKEDVLKYMASCIHSQNGWVAKELELGSYMDAHIEDLCDKVL